MWCVEKKFESSVSPWTYRPRCHGELERYREDYMALEGVQNPNTQDLPEDEQGSIRGL